MSKREESIDQINAGFRRVLEALQRLEKITNDLKAEIEKEFGISDYKECIIDPLGNKGSVVAIYGKDQKGNLVKIWERDEASAVGIVEPMEEAPVELQNRDWWTDPPKTDTTGLKDWDSFNANEYFKLPPKEMERLIFGSW